jgi:hypothetical protein
MSAKLSRIAKYTTQQEFELVRDALSTEPRALDKQALRKRIGGHCQTNLSGSNEGC